jgi:membrane associated rhomboid family serine protease
VFILIPWKVDVPQERWPVMNWLIIAALVATFALQVADVLDHVAGQDIRTPGTQQNLPTSPQESPNESDRRNQPQIPGITGRLLLQDWSLKGLFGYMWLHGDPLHLAGNVLFLWIFGNAVCAKLGNLLYLILYVFCGVLAGVVHLLFVSGPVLGASGAINGVVGMYLVLFYENEITCVFGWLIPPLLKCFDVSSIWMIVFWLFWDIVGALRGGSGVAYFAHLGGFAGGFGVMLLLCAKGWVTMERYEKWLFQAWQRRQGEYQPDGYNADLARLGLAGRTEPQLEPSPIPLAVPRTIPLPKTGPPNPGRNLLDDSVIRTVCPCGKDTKVSRQYGGKTIRCPVCNQPVVIPHKTDSFGPAPQQPKTASRPPARVGDRIIRFACTCGKRISAPARYAGRSGKCPQCGLRLRIPPASV